MKNRLIPTHSFCLFIALLCILCLSCLSKKREHFENNNWLKSESIALKNLSQIDTSDISIGMFVDFRDNKEYRTIKLGDQVWFAENLAFQPSVGDYWPYEEDMTKVSNYGYLYFWETANNVCPDGWHLPSYEEWDTLISTLGGKTVAGVKLKSAEGWYSPSKEQTNSSGFSILPAGNRSVGGKFYHLGNDALLWTSTPKSDKSAYKVRLNDQCDSIWFQASSKSTGHSIRCIKD